MSLARWLRPSAGRLEDRALRVRKANKILAVLTEELGGDLANLTCLDVGCSAGLITERLAQRFRLTVGVELDANALAGRERSDAIGLYFICGDGERLPLQDHSVDVVICAQVYEHVGDTRRLFAEIDRVLAPGGVCFFSGPNKWFPIEMHTGLPLLHWLPRPWAVALSRRLGRGEYDVRPLTIGALRRRLYAFEIKDYTLAMLREPQTYSCADELGGLAWIGSLPGWLLKWLLPLTPNVNWILRPKGAGHGCL
ncbi:MAG: class I SAM-dependent methyltransferase [Chloroflexi bacterium]|nr:class I SAM-dependent methyltransferase [Chloroflexota bacterium]